MLTQKELKDIIDIGAALTREKDKNRLLEMILVKAMELSNCDAGTLYLYQNDCLEFKIMKTFSQNVSKGVRGEKIDLPPVPMKEGNVCSYSAIHKELINISDVYDSRQFDFSGPKKYDAITGYRTRSMLVIPMTDMQEGLVGVLQLINAMDPEGMVTAFTKEHEFVLRSLSSQAAVAVSNMIYVREIKRQLYSFAAAMATAIDERTPYNGTHTRKVALYAEALAEYINQLNREGRCQEFFDENRKEQLVLAAALHDIGKMIIPLSVMNKPARLGERMERLKDRFRLISVYYELDRERGRITEEELKEKKAFLQESLSFLTEIDTSGCLSEEQIKRVEKIGAQIYETEDGVGIPYMTEEERECLIIQKGTLTKEERRLMESHVAMTEKILDKVHFSANYGNVAKFAASHHEFLNGTGYPKQLKGEELELESRILTVVDIYDALTSSDRPYKKPMSGEKAFSILHSMAEEGKLEERLVTWLEEALKNIQIKNQEDLMLF